MKSTTRVLVALVLIAGAAFALKQISRGSGAQSGSAAPERAGRPTNILLITLDTVRADRIGAYGYAAARTPNLDALAKSGVRFDDAVTVAPITGPAHAAILTGMHPGRFAVRDNATTPLADRAETVAEILKGRGFDTGGFVGAFILDRPYGFAQGFDTFGSGFTRVDSGSEVNVERPANAVVDDALGWLAKVRADRSFFAWVHLYDAHVGYAPPAPFAQDYDGEIAFVDQQVGRLIEGLRARDALERTLVIVTADHGESLGEHGEAEHAVFLYDAVLRVPLIASGPGARHGHIITEQVRVVDIVPTMLDAVGATRPAKIDGESLVPLLQGGTRQTVPQAYAESYYPKLHYGWSELRAIRADGWKAIDAPKPELYNLREDPKELHNRYAANQALADRMIAESVRAEREITGGAAAIAAQPDRETAERLRSLGYVGSSAPLPGGVRGPDPKDHIAKQVEFQRLMNDAVDDLRGGRVHASIPKLRRLAAINPRAYDVHQFLGEAYQRTGRAAEALGEYEYAALVNPSSVLPLIAIAEVHMKNGDLARARAWLDKAMKVDPRSYDVHTLAGKIHEREGRMPEALAAYEAAVTVNPVNPRAHAQAAAVAARLGRFDVAEQRLRALLQMGYQPARAHVGLGQMAHARGRTAEAAASYREALRLEPGLPMAIEGLRRLGVQ